MTKKPKKNCINYRNFVLKNVMDCVKKCIITKQVLHVLLKFFVSKVADIRRFCYFSGVKAFVLEGSNNAHNI
jgi:hypothetical protein